MKAIVVSGSSSPGPLGPSVDRVRRQATPALAFGPILVLGLLWAAPVQAQVPYLVKDIDLVGAGSNPSNLANVNGTLFFSANNGTTGEELWKSDGTAAGTVLVKDINPGPTASSPINLTNVNGTLFFSANNGTTGLELWKSDGTAAGTVLVKDINPGSGASSPSDFANVNGTLFFSASNGTSGAELWKSDGSTAGTVLVKDINAGSGGSSPHSFTPVNGVLFFVAFDPANTGDELWRSDGTAAGTVLVKAISPGLTAGPSYLTNVNGTLFFIARGTTTGLWKSDGSTAGTVLVKDINPSIATSFAQYLTNVNGTLFFAADNGTSGFELWKSDGTAAGTVLLKDILPGSATSSLYGLTNVNGTLFFAATDGLTNDVELWRSDGTAAGTVQVKDINPGSGASFPDRLINVNGTLFFTANDGTNGTELWKSDGTAAGTLLVGDIFSGPAGSSPSDLTLSGPRLFFAANDGVAGRELWALTSADVSLTLTDGQATAVPGATVTYAIAVMNGGPDAAVATVSDIFPATLPSVAWTCVASGGATCGASGSGAITDTANLPMGGTITYSATATVSPSATGALVNTASVVVQGFADPNLANNSATDTDTLTPQADLSITKTDGLVTAAPGQALFYAIVAANAGPSGAPGAMVTDAVAAALTGTTWTCTGSGGGVCTASGSGSISDSVNLPVGASVTYTLTGTLSPSATGSIANTATVTAPGGVVDSNLANNSATDTDVLLSCATPLAVVPDGRLTPSLVAAGTTAWFGASLRIGNSYSLEFESAIGSTPPGTLTVYSGDDGCGGTSTLVTTNTADVDPPGTGASQRVSFTATGTAGYFRARLVNGSGTGIPFAFSWSDTTMFSPAWSDNGAFDTFYSFQNTTGSSLIGTLKLLDVSGATLTTLALTIPAGQTVSTNTRAIGIARNLTGTARFTHDGPPGAVVAEAAIARFSISPAYVQPIKFQAIREAR